MHAAYVALQGHQVIAGGHVPYLDDSWLQGPLPCPAGRRGHGEAAAITAITAAEDFALFALEHHYLLAVGCLPQPQGLIIAACCQPQAVRAEGNGPDRPPMPCERDQ